MSQTDQRGEPFVRVFAGDSAGGVRIDMGAYERQTLDTVTFAVDTVIDENDGDYSAGNFSLREAVGLANGSIGFETITFAAALDAGTILLGMGELRIHDSG